MCAVTRNVTNVTLNWKLQPGSPALLLPPNSLVISASTSLTSWDSHTTEARLEWPRHMVLQGIGGGVFSYTWRKDCELAKNWQKIVKQCWYLDKIVSKKIIVSEIPKTTSMGGCGELNRIADQSRLMLEALEAPLADSRAAAVNIRLISCIGRHSHNLI